VPELEVLRDGQVRDQLTVLVSGPCKSAGTLLAIGANELAFTPYGELGPLDIQLTKVDKFQQQESGLMISDSLNMIPALLRARCMVRAAPSPLSSWAAMW